MSIQIYAEVGEVTEKIHDLKFQNNGFLRKEIKVMRLSATSGRWQDSGELR
jgi:hypothetical protein